MDSSKMSSSSARHKIFEAWPKKLQKQQSYYKDNLSKRKKRNQSLRAEEALQKSLLFLNNIKTFLSEMETYEQKHEEDEKQLYRLLNELDAINSDNSQNYDDHLLKRTLGQYYKKVREVGKNGKNFKSFSLANLQNYDKRQTTMKFTRTDEEARKQLLAKVNDLQQKRRRVQDTLVGYEYGIPESQILGDQNKFQRRLQNLLHGINQTNIIEFHYLMMYQLRRLQRLREKHEKLMLHSHQNYSRYQGLNDSMNLMKNQANEMRKDRKQMIKKFEDLTYENADDIIPQSMSSLPILSKNCHVYNSNMSLLARYSAETTLKEYDERRRAYATQLKKYSSIFHRWKEEQTYASHIYQKHHQALNDFRKRRDLAGTQAQQREKEILKKVYLDCLQYYVPQNMKPIIAYKYKVVDELQKTMKECNMIIPKRIADSVLTKNDSLRKYFDFFVQMEYKQIPQKIPYLLENKETLNFLASEIKEEFKEMGHTHETQKYKFGLTYAQIIVKYEEDKNEQRVFDGIQKYLKKRWQALPIGLQPVFYHFMEDLRTKKQFYTYMKDFEQKMQIYCNKMKEDIRKIAKWQNYVQTAQIAYLMLENQTAQRRYPYKYFIRKISRYTPNLKNEMEEVYWKIAQKAIRNAYEIIINQLNIISGVDKKHFFTCKILCYLTQSNRKLKVANIEELLQYLIDTFDKNYGNKWNSKHMFIEIIKLRMLIDYLENVLSQFRKVDMYLQIVKNIKWCTLLLYEVNDHLSLVDQDDIFVHIRHSLKIYRSYTDNDIKYKKTDNIYLQDKSLSLIGGMKKYPLILGTKHELKDYQNLFDLQAKFESIKSLSYDPDGSMFFLSRTYVTCLQLYDIYLNSQKQFQPSDIVSVKEHIKHVVYLQKIAQKSNKTLVKKLPEITLVGNIYRGQTYDKKKQLKDEDLRKIIDVLVEMSDKMMESNERLQLN